MSILGYTPKEIIFGFIVLVGIKIIFNVLLKHCNVFTYRNEEREKELEAKQYKLKKIIGDEEETRLVEDLIASKVQIEATSKLFCNTSRAYDIIDKHLTEEILNRRSKDK